MQNNALWSAVILQARDDIADEHMGSVEYGAAVAFFTHAGEWGESRRAIADQIGLHADDLERLGRATIAARRAAEGLPPAPLESKPRPPKPRPPLPRLVAIPAPRPTPQPANDNRRRRRAEHVKRLCNPFSPFRHQA